MKAKAWHKQHETLYKHLASCKHATTTRNAFRVVKPASLETSRSYVNKFAERSETSTPCPPKLKEEHGIEARSLLRKKYSHQM